MQVKVPGGWRAAAVAFLAVLTVVVIAATLLGDLPGQGGGGTRGSGSPGAASSRGAGTSPTAAPAGDVLAPAGTSGPLPSPAGLQRVLDPLLGQPTLGARVGAAVLDLSTGRLLYGHDASSGYSTASTTKLLTAAAALQVLGPDYRIRTTVVAGAAAGQIVLVGGGDPTLATAAPAGFVPAPASLPALARATAEALRARGTRSVRLGYDSSLFSGPQTAAPWPGGYVGSGVVAPVSALTVDEGRVGLIAEGPAARVPDPAMGAARAFARQLGLQGITVTGAPARAAAPAPPAAPAGTPGPSSGSAAGSAPGPSGTGLPVPPAGPGTMLASVSSPALSDLLGWMLSTSDNDLAEALAHLVAHAQGQPADFPGAVTAVTDVLGRLGIPTEQLRMYDGSGLSPQTQVEPRVLGAVLVAAASPAHTQLRPLLTGLAVAGFTGSLGPPRFDSPGTTAASGLIRAKTGTLTGVSAIAGTVQDAAGRTLAFVFVADRVPATGTLAARVALDRLAAAVAGCGCG